MLAVSGSALSVGDRVTAADLSSPAGCFLNAQISHVSGTPGFEHVVNHKVNFNCAYSVSRSGQVWGDRSSWSGWRQHAEKMPIGPETVQKSEYFSPSTGLAGTYDYRTRAKGHSHEGGRTYSAEVTGKTRRITCVDWLGTIDYCYTAK